MEAWRRWKMVPRYRAKCMLHHPLWLSPPANSELVQNSCVGQNGGQQTSVEQPLSTPSFERFKDPLLRLNKLQRLKTAVEYNIMHDLWYCGFCERFEGV